MWTTAGRPTIDEWISSNDVWRAGACCEKASCRAASRFCWRRERWAEKRRCLSDGLSEGELNRGSFSSRGR